MMLFFLVSVILSSVYANDKPGSSPSHCFKRAYIGERLVGYDVTRIIEQNTVKGCEDECNVYKCTHFSFGVAGNGTCELTTGRQISRRQDPDFDVYERTEECAEGKPTGYEQVLNDKGLFETEHFPLLRIMPSGLPDSNAIVVKMKKVKRSNSSGPHYSHLVLPRPCFTFN